MYDTPWHSFIICRPTKAVASVPSRREQQRSIQSLERGLPQPSKINTPYYGHYHNEVRTARTHKGREGRSAFLLSL